MKVEVGDLIVIFNPNTNGIIHPLHNADSFEEFPKVEQILLENIKGSVGEILGRSGSLFLVQIPHLRKSGIFLRHEFTPL